MINLNEAQKTRRYLGDGVYASFDGFHIILTTQIDDKQVHIALYDDVLNNLLTYASTYFNVRVEVEKYEKN